MNQRITLRDVQKADTHQRLLDAASRVFDREGFDAATVDQITAEAGASRPTFYAHFRDKEQVLAELMAAYMARAVPFMEKLPGPRPSVDALKLWLHDIGSFLEQENALFSLVNQVVGHRPPDSPNYGLDVVDAWITALATRSPAFAAAADRDKANVKARAQAELLVIEIVWAGCNVLVDSANEFTGETVELVAAHLHKFLNDPQFRRPRSK